MRALPHFGVRDADHDRIVGWNGEPRGDFGASSARLRADLKGMARASARAPPAALTPARKARRLSGLPDVICFAL